MSRSMKERRIEAQKKAAARAAMEGAHMLGQQGRNVNLIEWPRQMAPFTMQIPSSHGMNLHLSGGATKVHWCAAMIAAALVREQEWGDPDHIAGRAVEIAAAVMQRADQWEQEEIAADKEANRQAREEDSPDEEVGDDEQEDEQSPSPIIQP